MEEREQNGEETADPGGVTVDEPTKTSLDPDDEDLGDGDE